MEGSGGISGYSWSRCNDWKDCLGYIKANLDRCQTMSEVEVHIPEEITNNDNTENELTLELKKKISDLLATIKFIHVLGPDCN